MRNWRIISNGDDFESLVGSLLMAEFPGIVVFGRSGPDSGLDSISPDRTHVYQAKYHCDGLMASAIVSAKSELEKIRSYRDPAHRNFIFWKDVTEWSLVGNFEINPTDEARWRDQVEPAFKSIGIMAHFIGEERLGLMLDRNPEIEHSYFGGHIRALIYPAEVFMRLFRKASDGAFFAPKMVGRESSVAEVLKFAEACNERVLSVVGPHSSGKTRFLYESMMALAKIGWRVFWGLPESMGRSGAWFDSLQSSSRTCVFLDDPKDPTVVGSMIEQLSVGERAKWKLVFTCSCERARILAPEYATDAQFRTLQLPLLSRDDVAKIIAQYPGLEGRSPSVDGVADMAKGMPSLVCLILEFYKQNRHLALPPDSLALMDCHVEKCLDVFGSEPELKKKAWVVLRWVSAWDGIVVWDDDVSNPQLQYLLSLGVQCDETKVILKRLSRNALLDAWKSYGRDCYRVQPALIRRHILGAWLLEKDGEAYQVGSDGRGLIGRLIKGGVPDADKIFQNIPAVLGAYLHAEDEAERLFRPVFEYLKGLTKCDDIDSQFGIIDMLKKIGCFAPESTLMLLRSVFTSPRTESKYLDRWDIVLSIANTLAAVAEYVRERPLAVRYLSFFKEIYEATPDELGRPNGKRDQIAQALAAVVNHFGELRYFPDVALSLVVDRLKEGAISEHPFEQMLAKKMLEAERQSFESHTSRTITFCRRAILLGSCEWNRATAIREALARALTYQTVASEREILWDLYKHGYQFAHNLCSGFVHHGHRETTEAAHKLIVKDLAFLKTSLENKACERSIRELQLMRNVWKWECEYGDETELKELAMTCEELFVSRVGFPFQHLMCLHSEAHDQCVKDVTDRFLQAKSADEIDVFIHRAADYFRAANGGSLKGVSGYAFREISAMCLNHFDVDGTAPIGEFTLRCLRRFDDEHPMSVAFATTQVGNFIRVQKSSLDHDGFAALFDRLFAEAKDKDCFLKELYGDGDAVFFGPRTAVEFEHLMASSMAPFDLARVLPSWIAMNRPCVLDRLSAALEEARISGSGSHAVLETIVRSFYFAAHFRKQLDVALIPLEWIVGRFNEGYAAASFLTEYTFGELCKLATKKLGMTTLQNFVESWIRRERFSGCDYFDEERFHPQELFAIDDASVFGRVCDLIFVEDSLFVSMRLGRIISSIDPTCENTFNYVAEYMRTHSCDGREELSRLARLIAYSQTSDKTKAIMEMICKRCQLWCTDERTYVYYHMMPDEHGAFWSDDKVPDKYLDVRTAAQRLYDSEPEESPVKEFYKYCFERANGTIAMIRNSIEERMHE